MPAQVAAFAGDEHDAMTAVGLLAGMGFELGPRRPVTRSLLDTFDGRLHRAGLRLELSDSDGLELVLTAEGSARAHLAVASGPRFVDDLPPGPFRARLTAVAEVRALIPVLRVDATRARALRRNRAGKVVASVAIYEHVRVEDHDVVPWAIEVDELAGYAKHASNVRDALARLGLARLDGDTITVAAAASGVDLAGRSGPSSVPLDSGMPAIVGFRAVL